MKHEEAFAFVQELDAPLHVEGLRDPAKRGDRDDVALNASWRILVPQGADLIVETAVEDFRDFMRVSMGEDLPVERYDPASGPVNDARAIVVRTADRTEDVDRQSFTFRSAGDWLAIEAGGSAGVLYGFLFLEDLLSERRIPYLKPMRVERRPLFETRIVRAPHAPYYTNELDDDTTYYTDNYLARLAHHGANGVWIHQRLRDLAATSVFPEYGQGREKRLAKLNYLIDRAGRWGIRVYLYLNEPRAFPAESPFYKSHPDAKGHRNDDNVMEGGGPYFAMCTSSEEVKRSLVESSADLFRAAPGLGGVLLITMSEHLTSCWSHLAPAKGEKPSCPRCADRDPSEGVAEIVNLVAEGVHSASPDALVVAWTWSWDRVEPVPHEKLIGALRDDVIVMADFERGQWLTHRKRRWFADEYMLSLPGPTDDFRKKRRLTQKLGRKVYAKIQIANTHELATVPYIPVPCKLHEKLSNMRAEGVRGYMGCWIFGSYPSIMTELAGRYSWEPAPENDDGYLRRLAGRIYGDDAAPDVLLAWKKMSRAFGNYPFSQHLVYWGPMNYTCIYPFRLTSAGVAPGTSWRVHDTIGDGSSWARLGLDTPDEPAFIREEFQILVAGWREGLRDLASALEKTPERLRDSAARDFGVAEATMLHLDSTTHILAFLEARVRLERGENPSEALAAMRAAMEAELANRARLLELSRADSRLGFHSEAGYWYRPEKIESAIAELERQLREDLPRLVC
ncbi:MAG: hypothetical protein V2A58_13980 [Planctomycetota bacterium]